MRENDLTKIVVDVAFHMYQRLEPALNEFGLETHAKAQSREVEQCNESLSLCALAPVRETVFK